MNRVLAQFHQNSGYRFWLTTGHYLDVAHFKSGGFRSTGVLKL